MGEHTRTQPETQSQDSKPPSPFRPMKSEPNLDSNSQSLPQSTLSTDLATSIATNASEFLQNSQNHYSNPSKIPIRPQKIWKLSSTNTDTTPTADKESPPPQITVDDSSSNSKLSISTVIVEPPATTITTKNRRRSASQLSRLLP
ncbi:putative DNA-3-methyladenine glycosylase YfjP [Forsythia ovata]|uniref:DNA-3-methyladenine glycosylase YfjP n=1 Tax=Forsythia ovata TaxID=205694 RepID=A0ABD1S1J3_9LAMI